MGYSDFRERMLAGDSLAGTFLKTPAYELIEILAGTTLDFVCLDAEHAPFDRGRMDACLAMARALDFPTLVRVGSGSPENILQALDSGAVGIVCPHVDSAAKAREIARAGRFGHGGRGYAGSTRWAGYTRNAMPDILRKSREETPDHRPDRRTRGRRGRGRDRGNRGDRRAVHRPGGPVGGLWQDRYECRRIA